MYKYELEIIKINNRIDLIEARKYAQRKFFKSTSTDTNSINIIKLDKTSNNNNEEREKYPQVCMIMPRQPEFKKYEFKSEE